MLFKVEMTVNIPASLPKDQADAIKAEEKAYSQRLQRCISGASPGFTPTSAFLTSPTTRSCTIFSPGCRCIPL